MTHARLRRFVTLAGLALAAAGAGAAGLAAIEACVPADTRPTPGSVTFTVSASPAVANGVVTADGWSVQFERVLMSMGNTVLGAGCVDYAEARYDRVVDVKKNPEPQKVSILHGLGECDVRFRISSPNADAVLGKDITEDEKSALRIPATDYWVRNAGTSVAIFGSASREGVTKRFQMVFRPRLRYARCTTPEQDGGQALTLIENVDQFFDIAIEAEAILRDDVDAKAASLRFDPFAAADRDGDGTITLDELRTVPIAAIRDAGPFEAGTYEFDDDAGIFRQARSVPIDTLGDYVYVLLFPTLPRFRGEGTCGVGVGRLISQQRPPTAN